MKNAKNNTKEVTVNNEVKTVNVQGFTPTTMGKIYEIFPQLTIIRQAESLSKLCKNTNWQDMFKDTKQLLGYYYILKKKYDLVTRHHNKLIKTYKEENGWDNELKDFIEPTIEIKNGLRELEVAAHLAKEGITKYESEILSKLEIKIYPFYARYIRTLTDESNTIPMKAYFVAMCELFTQFGLKPSKQAVDNAIRAIGIKTKNLSSDNKNTCGAMDKKQYIVSLVSYFVQILIDKGLVDLNIYTKDLKFLEKIKNEDVKNLASFVQKMFIDITPEQIGTK